jgi:hypothetical protein
MNNLKKAAVQEVVNSLNPKKWGYDLITGKILKELPIIGIKYLSLLLNAVLLKGYFSAQWRIAQIILVLKPELTSCLPISLLPIVSKVFEKLLLKRLSTVVESNNHKFIFRQRHSSMEQTHRIVRRIN